MTVMKGKSLLILCVAFVLHSCACIERLQVLTAKSDKASAERTESGPERVRFPSNDADLTGGSPTIIDGYLFKPAGQGPFPALVALHGCSGLFTQSGGFQKRDWDWAKRLQSLGYVVLFPDSLTPRGIEEICTRKDIGGAMPFRERPRDAYGALRWLQSQPFVRKDRASALWDGPTEAQPSFQLSMQGRGPSRPVSQTISVWPSPSIRAAGLPNKMSTGLPISL